MVEKGKKEKQERKISLENLVQSQSRHFSATHVQMSRRLRLTLVSTITTYATISCLSCFATVFDEPASSSQPVNPDSITQSPKAQFLKGEIEHQEKLPAIDPRLRIGKKFHPAKLTALTPNNEWFVVPSWFAGEWHQDEQTIVLLKDYRTGVIDSGRREIKNIGDGRWGELRDKQGQVWAFIEIPRSNQIEIETGTEYLQFLREDVIESNQSEVSIRMLENQIVVDDKLKIKSVKQAEEIEVFTPVEDGLVRAKGSLKIFSRDGNPELLEKTDMLVKRTAKFEEKDRAGDLDLKPLFREFLTKTGRPDLLP